MLGSAERLRTKAVLNRPSQTALLAIRETQEVQMRVQTERAVMNLRTGMSLKTNNGSDLPQCIRNYKEAENSTAVIPTSLIAITRLEPS